MPRVLPPLAVALTCLVGASACDDARGPGLDEYAVALDLPPTTTDKIDVLFVIDNSGSMRDNLSEVAEQAKTALVDVLSYALGTPDLHLGVITSDMGALGTPSNGCGGLGDAGALMNRPRYLGQGSQPTCAGLADDARFLVDRTDADGAHATNYDGELVDALGCMVSQGGDGCGFEQPFAAIAAAIDPDHPINADFLRDDAILAVVLLTDEDDCSAADPALYGDDPGLGPKDSFRCFQYAVACDGDDPDPGVAGAPGPRSGCELRPEPRYHTPVQALVDQLVARKGGDPSRIIVASFDGGVGPVVVDTYPAGDGTDTTWLTLAPSCGAPNTAPGGAPRTAAPALRLAALRDAFPGRAWSESICGDLGAGLERTAEVVADVAGARPCLRGALRDADATTPGIQPTCRAVAVHSLDGGELTTAVPACAGDAATGCFALVADADACPGSDSGLRVELRGVAVDDAHLVVSCLPPALAAP
ncbi:MAG: hypothetical protein R2939_16405 [Kofleriaceae bacterium]